MSHSTRFNLEALVITLLVSTEIMRNHATCPNKYIRALKKTTVPTAETSERVLRERPEINK
jgi:hypothetical protein